ncbi:hypothetical protein WA158_001442 [Blastocystis sp. Blastoise]
MIPSHEKLLMVVIIQFSSWSRIDVSFSQPNLKLQYQNIVVNRSDILPKPQNNTENYKKVYHSANTTTRFWKSFDYYKKSVERSREHVKDKPNGRKDYSYYQIYMPSYRRGLRYAYMSNVCLDMKHYEIRYYYPTDDTRYRRMTEIINRETEHFRWGAHFREISSAFPYRDHPVIRKKYIAMTFAAWGRHLGHTLETVFTVLNLVMDPNYLQGPIDYFLYPNMNNEIEFNNEIMRVIEQYSSNNGYKVFYGDSAFNSFDIDIQFDPIICFDQVVIVDRNENMFNGGIFTMDFTSDLIRAAIYHQFYFIYKRYNKEKYNLLVINRLERRKFTNINEIENILNKNFNNTIHYSITFFDHKFFESQVRTIYNNDIIFISHGQGEITLLFAKPYSVFIEGNGPYFYERYGHILSILFRLYIIHPNNQYTLQDPEEQFQVCLNNTLLVTMGGDCKQSSIYGDIYLYREYIKSSIQEAIDYLNGIDFDHYLPDSNYIF